MLLFNFKLFFKIAVAILSGTSVSSSDTLSADTMVKSEPIHPKIENVKNEIKQENTLEFNRWDQVSIDSLDSIIRIPKTNPKFKISSSKKLVLEIRY